LIYINCLAVGRGYVEISAIFGPVTYPLLGLARKIKVHGGETLIDRYAIIGQRHYKAVADQFYIPG
jgi:hypothetical protein